MQDSLTADNSWNVLSEQVELEGTLRTHHSALRQQIPERMMTTLIQSIVAAQSVSKSDTVI